MAVIRAEIKGVPLELETDSMVFSPSGVDRGTLAMLELAEFRPGDKVLDLGCGCGVVGILAGRLLGEDQAVLCDVQPEAVELSRRNAARNGLSNLAVVQSDGPVGEGYRLILSNPPYHADFSVPKGFIEEGFRRLAVGGRMMMVTKRRDWYRNKLAAVFGGVRVWERDGYYVFLAEKRRAAPARQKKSREPALSPKLRRRMERKGKNNRATPK